MDVYKDNSVYRSTERNILSLDIINKYKLNDVVFFDIECTGFNKDIDKIFSISIGKFNDGVFEASVYFNAYDEEKLLREVYSSFNKDNICTFNGMALDIPFLNARFEKYNINKLSYTKHYDFYRMLCPYVKVLGSKGKSLKNFEMLIGISRKDNIDGKECRDKYFEYIKYNDSKYIDEIVQHNLEDVLNLPKLFNIVSYISANNLKRDDSILNSQQQYVKRLLNIRKLNGNIVESSVVSQKDARKLIYELKRKNTDLDSINSIITDIKNREKLYK